MHEKARIQKVNRLCRKSEEKRRGLQDTIRDRGRPIYVVGSETIMKRGGSTLKAKLALHVERLASNSFIKARKKKGMRAFS